MAEQSEKSAGCSVNTVRMPECSCCLMNVEVERKENDASGISFNSINSCCIQDFGPDRIPPERTQRTSCQKQTFLTHFSNDYGLLNREAFLFYTYYEGSETPHFFIQRNLSARLLC